MPCRRCNLTAGTREVPARTPESPLAAVIGDYPSTADEKQLQPFRDPPSLFLRGALTQLGLVPDEDLIFLHALRCAPPRPAKGEPRSKKAKVTDEHLNACHNWVQQDLQPLIQLPEKLILVCGDLALTSLLGSRELGEDENYLRGQWIAHQGWAYLPTFRPGYVASMTPYRHDMPGQKWWVVAGSVPWFWRQDLEKFANRVLALKESCLETR